MVRELRPHVVKERSVDMKIIHTSDWHWGGRLHDQDRYAEHEAFAVWLRTLLRHEKPDALVVAGDIFDTCAPSNRAQEGYYSLLAGIYKDELCRAVVVIGGNHDSPSMLNAPAQALVHLKAWVIGEIDAGNPAGEVVLVPDATGKPGLVIAAVPYLREGDLRRDDAGDAEADRTAKLQEGFRAHYAHVAALAREAAGPGVPLVLTGHLNLSGATLSDVRSERALRIGNLGAMPAALLPPADYYAFGHLHTPQALGGHDCCRYSGSPLPMSFAEAGQAKSVAVVEFGPNAGDSVTVRLEEVPVFQRLEQVQGSPDGVSARLRELVAAKASVWVEVQVTTGDGDLGPLWNSLPGLVEGSAVQILAQQDCRPQARPDGARSAEVIGLEQLTPLEVFRMRLADDGGLSDEERQWLPALFAEVLKSVQEADAQRE